MTDVPEIERLQAEASPPNAVSGMRVVNISDAEHAVLTALARQRREIVEALREYADESELGDSLVYRQVADFIESRFGPKEADPR